MATTVDNPFDTQQAQSNNQTPNTTGGTQPMNTGSAANTGYQQFNPVPNVQPQTYSAQTSQVNAPNETVAGQVNSILATDSPLMQRARTLATQQMNQRGLVNTSMAQGAGVAAMVDRATPIAAQDAQTFNQRTLANQDATNQANQFNTAQTNQMFQFGQDLASRTGLTREQQQFQAGQAALDRAQQTQLQSNQFGFQGTQADLDRFQQAQLQANQFGFQGQQSALDRGFQAQQNQFQRDFQQQIAVLEQSGLDFRQARDIASREMLTRLEQAGINNRFDQELALKSQQFNAEQINLERRQIIDNNAQLQRLNLQINANNQNIPTSFAASISNTTMAGVNAVMSDPNMSADAKRSAISNLVSYANAQIAWAEKFYNTAIPRISTPI
jgi:hypothetical protein